MARRKLKCSKCDRTFAMAAHLARHQNASHGSPKSKGGQIRRRRTRRGSSGSSAGRAMAMSGAGDVGGLLVQMEAMLGDLSRVVRVVKVLGMVNSDPDFIEQPAVINGFSDLIVEVFGERGRHARAAVGMASLPRGQAVEIEMIVEVRD